MIGEVQAFVDRWSSAFNAGDLELLETFYVDHARVIPPNGPLYANDGNLKAYFADIKRQGFGGFTFIITDLVDQRGTYLASGRWQLVGPGPYDMPHRYKGNWLNVLDRDSGGWRIVTQMWN